MMLRMFSLFLFLADRYKEKSPIFEILDLILKS